MTNHLLDLLQEWREGCNFCGLGWGWEVQKRTSSLCWVRRQLPVIFRAEPNYLLLGVRASTNVRPNREQMTFTPTALALSRFYFLSHQINIVGKNTTNSCFIVVPLLHLSSLFFITSSTADTLPLATYNLLFPADGFHWHFLVTGPFSISFLLIKLSHLVFSDHPFSLDQALLLVPTFEAFCILRNHTVKNQKWQLASWPSSKLY